MERISPESCIPIAWRRGLPDLKAAKDLAYYGRENLECLIQFWKNRMDAYSEKLKNESDSEKRDDYQQEINACRAKQNYLTDMVGHSQTKPLLFDREVLYVGSRVVYFEPEHGRFVSGIVDKIYRDKQSGKGSFDIRVDDKTLTDGREIVSYTPDGLSLYSDKDFEYYLKHPKFFRQTLEYRAAATTPSEIAYINRLVTTAQIQATMLDRF